MENEALMGGLMRKRADLAGELALLHDQVRAVKERLAHVEATMRLFQPDIDFSGARVSRIVGPQAAEYGQMSRAVRKVLREAEGWLTIPALAERVAEARGMRNPDMAVVKKRVGAALRNFKRRGQTESRHGVGLALEWKGSDAG